MNHQCLPYWPSFSKFDRDAYLGDANTDGMLDAGAFTSATAATAAGHRFGWDSVAQELWYDPTGSGGGGAADQVTVLTLVELGSTPTLTVTSGQITFFA